MYWYEDEVIRLEKENINRNYVPDTLFYGSSSLRMWTTLSRDFPDLKPANLGFGGSTLAACVWFFERIMAPYQPKRIIIYAGDNDLGDGRHPEEVFIFFQQLAVKIIKRFDSIPIYYISLKPSVSRENLIGQYIYTNSLISSEIKTYPVNWHFIDVFNKMIDSAGKPIKANYATDGLHLSEAGYQLWKEVVNCALTAEH